MAGGFGRSKYLFAAFKNALDSGIEVLQSRGPGPYVNFFSDQTRSNSC